LPLKYLFMKKKKYQLGLLPLIILVVLYLVIGHVLFGCSKEIEPNQARVIQMRHIYNNTTEWKYLRTEVVKDFGIIRQPELQFYLDQRFDTSFICTEPWKLYWSIKF